MLDSEQNALLNFCLLVPQQNVHNFVSTVKYMVACLGYLKREMSWFLREYREVKIQGTGPPRSV